MDAVEGAMRPTWRSPLRRAVTLFILFSVVILLIMTFTSRTQVSVVVVNPVYMEQTTFAVVFDAGSTGTRIHVFEFRREDDESLALLKETFSETKPGLSSYANDIVKAEESVRNLLQSAIRVVPHKKRKNTPVILKATAGLRLLPGRKAKMILQKVKTTLSESPFRAESVSIMNGDDEGLYGWETVNYLLGNFQETKTNKLYGIVDMGGGSFQVTYALPNILQDKFQRRIEDSYLRKVRFGSGQFLLYDHSYLGLGLMSTRMAILNETFMASTELNKIKVVNPCFPLGFSYSWVFHGIEFLISGSDQCSFESCRDVAMKVITQVSKPEAMGKSKVFLLSYFFDRAVEAGLIDSKSGGELQVEDYIDAAQTICQRGNVKNSPFFCLDMTYLSTLLTDGFGFGLHKKLLLRNKINGFEVSWPLGVALSLYNQ